MFQMININQFNDDDRDGNAAPVRLSCFIHSLQLCVRDGLKNGAHMPKVLNKCKILAKFSHKSSKMADLLDDINKSINKMNVTRWNSEYLLIQSILSIQHADMESILASLEYPVKFTNNDYSILHEVIYILDPFYELSIKCQAETVVTASLVVPGIVHLIRHLREPKKKVVLCKKLIEQLQLSIEKRFAGIINRLNQLNVGEDDPFNDPLYFMATVLDPCFKFHWLRDLQLPANAENRLKQNIIQLIFDEINKDVQAPTPKKVSDKNISSSPSKYKKIKLFDYNNYGDSDNLNYVAPADPSAEFNMYVDDPLKLKFSEYWVRSPFKNLKKLVMRIGTVQASSAPIERVFSHAGIILSQRRTRMGEQLFKDLVFLKVNQHLL
jgi:hypothetical protein